MLVDLEVSARVRDLARDLGHSGAGPREAALLHHRALRALTDPQPAPRARVLHEAGQTVFIELLGELAAFYRSLAFDEPPPRTSHSRPLTVASAAPEDPGAFGVNGRDHDQPGMEEPA